MGADRKVSQAEGMTFAKAMWWGIAEHTDHNDFQKR